MTNFSLNHIIFQRKKIEYYIYGKGNTEILLLQGWSLPPEIWFKSLKFISPEIVKAVAISLNKFELGNDCSLHSFSTLLGQFLEKIDFNPHVIVGHSMGVSIMLNSINESLLHPKGIIIVDSGLSSSYRNEELIDEIKKNKLSRELYKSILNSFFLNIEETELDLMLSKMIQSKRETLLCHLAAISDFDFKSSVARLNIPGLILFGKYDRNRRYEEALEFNRTMKNSQLKIFENSAHCPMYEEPENFAIAVRLFLEQILFSSPS
ncbi:MAG: alpha/beta hydrolase [Thermoplasmatales archaeon]